MGVCLLELVVLLRDESGYTYLLNVRPNVAASVPPVPNTPAPATVLRCVFIHAPHQGSSLETKVHSPSHLPAADCGGEPVVSDVKI
jgi:hypothetical protein